MNIKTSPFSILNRKRREIDCIKELYRNRVNSEIESYTDSEEEEKIDTMQAKDLLILAHSDI